MLSDYTEEDAEAEFKRLQEQPIKLAIIGRPNVAKSTLRFVMRVWWRETGYNITRDISARAGIVRM